MAVDCEGVVKDVTAMVQVAEQDGAITLFRCSASHEFKVQLKQSIGHNHNYGEGPYKGLVELSAY